MTILLAGEFSADERAEWAQALARALPGETLILDRAAADDESSIDVAIVANPPPGALAGLQGLALIQSLWAGVERLLTDTTLPAGVPIARMVDPAMAEAMAETALWAVLALHRGFFAYARRQQQVQWRTHRQRRAGDVEITVLGLGEIGRTVARRLAANGYPVTGFSQRPQALDGVRCVSGTANLPAVFGSAEIVINLLPLTPSTRGFINAERLSWLPPNASVVNLGRGGHVVEADLLAALDQGRLRHAVLDVFAEEPLPPAHPFWRHPSVTVLPHVAALTDVRSASGVAAANVRALRSGQAIKYCVDRQRGY